MKITEVKYFKKLVNFSGYISVRYVIIDIVMHEKQKTLVKILPILKVKKVMIKMY